MDKLVLLFLLLCDDNKTVEIYKSSWSRSQLRWVPFDDNKYDSRDNCYIIKTELPREILSNCSYIQYGNKDTIFYTISDSDTVKSYLEQKGYSIREIAFEDPWEGK